jgi:hypothetical protein
MIIRGEQVQALNDALVGRFEDELVLHMRDFAPALCRQHDEASVREIVRAGVRRATAIGLTRRAPIRLWLEMQFSLGSDFDSDPQLPWAAASLIDASQHPLGCAEALYAASGDYFDAVAGPDNQYMVEALRRAVDVPLGEFTRLSNADAFIARMASIYPQKVAYVGHAALRAVFGTAIDSAARYDVAPRGAPLIAGLMFAFGHGAVGDPLYPWVRSTLSDGSASADRGVSRLHERAVAYAKAVVRHLRSKG